MSNESGLPNRRRREELRQETDDRCIDMDADELRALLDALDLRTEMLREANQHVDTVGDHVMRDQIDAELEQDNDSK